MNHATAVVAMFDFSLLKKWSRSVAGHVGFVTPFTTVAGRRSAASGNFSLVVRRGVWDTEPRGWVRGSRLSGRYRLVVLRVTLSWRPCGRVAGSFGRVVVYGGEARELDA